MSTYITVCCQLILFNIYSNFFLHYSDIVAIELPAMEIQRNDLIVKINTDKQQLLALEDKVLKLLYNSQGNILDDEELVETLNDAKVIAPLHTFLYGLFSHILAFRKLH